MRSGNYVCWCGVFQGALAAEQPVLPAENPGASGGFWSGATPWWATVLIGLVAAGTALLVMVRNNHAAVRREAEKRRVDDQRADRITAAGVRSLCDVFVRAYRLYYEVWQASTDPENNIPPQHVSDLRSAARASVEALSIELMRAQVVLNSTELIALGDRIQDEQRMLMHKMDGYERGTAFRLPLRGSTDLLFAGVVEAMRDYLLASQRVTRD